METTTYLQRIGFSGALKPDVQTIHELQLAHLLTVPFENLDIGFKRPIRLDQHSLWDKIVVRRRGGFCYELNGMFAWLLEQIGFDVTYLNARVYNEEKDSFGIDFDHLTLLVRVPGEPGRWLVDVGFGDSFTRPLEMDNAEWQEQGLRAYRLEPFQDGYQLLQRGFDGKIDRQYYFDLMAHQFPAEYEAACVYHQTSPQSTFTHRRIISRLTANGRVSLDDKRLIITTNGQREEHPFESEDEYRSLLLKHFDVTL